MAYLHEVPHSSFEEWWNWRWSPDTPTTNYLYDLPKDRAQYYTQAVIAGIVPGMSNLYSYRDNTAFMDDYMTNRGLDYGDVKYPSRTVGWHGVSSLGSLVSENVKTLYD